MEDLTVRSAMFHLGLKRWTILLMTTGLVCADVSIFILNATKIQNKLETNRFPEAAKNICTEEFETFYGGRSTEPMLHFWSYNRFRKRMYCVLYSSFTVPINYEFRQSDTGTILLSPLSETMFSSDRNLHLGMVRFSVQQPNLAPNAGNVLEEIRGVLPEFQVSILLAEEKADTGSNLLSIEIVERNNISWNYPDFVMEALTKLESIVQSPTVREAKIVAMYWPSIEANRNNEVYIDTYYTTYGSRTGDICAEFLDTLQGNIAERLQCKASGEEQTPWHLKKVVKLQLLYIDKFKNAIIDANVYLKYVTLLKQRDGRYSYPVQVRPNSSFHEPSKYFPDPTGYSFIIMLDQSIQGKEYSKDPCTYLRNEASTYIAGCIPFKWEPVTQLHITTSEPNKGVLETLTEFMRDFDYRNSSSCSFNVALLLIDKLSPPS